MAQIITLASGKGGVGKSVIALNLSLSMALLGKRVVLADLDVGGACQHLLLGLPIKGVEPSIKDFWTGGKESIAEVIHPTQYENVGFIPGISGYIMNLSTAQKRRTLEGLAALTDYDLVVVDLGAGFGLSVIDFFLGGDERLLVINPEVTSVMTAYGLLKATVARIFYLAYPDGSRGRELITDFFNGRLEAPDQKNIMNLLEELELEDPETTTQIKEKFTNLNLRLVVNKTAGDEDVGMTKNLVNITHRKLGLLFKTLVFLPFDKSVVDSVIMRKPTVITNEFKRERGFKESFAHQVRYWAAKLNTNLGVR